jgi:hypothetical protein
VAGLPAHTIAGANSWAFDLALGVFRGACQHAGRRGVEVELAIAIGVRTRKLKKSSGRRMQNVRLLGWRARGCVFETQVHPNLFKSRKC